VYSGAQCLHMVRRVDEDGEADCGGLLQVYLVCLPSAFPCVSPVSPLCLPCVSSVSPLCLPCVSPVSPQCPLCPSSAFPTACLH
jgi:hypothetical protein